MPGIRSGRHGLRRCGAAHARSFPGLDRLPERSSAPLCAGRAAMRSLRVQRSRGSGLRAVCGCRTAPCCQHGGTTRRRRPEQHRQLRTLLRVTHHWRSWPRTQPRHTAGTSDGRATSASAELLDLLPADDELHNTSRTRCCDHRLNPANISPRTSASPSPALLTWLSSDLCSASTAAEKVSPQSGHHVRSKVMWLPQQTRPRWLSATASTSPSMTGNERPMDSGSLLATCSLHSPNSASVRKRVTWHCAG